MFDCASILDSVTLDTLGLEFGSNDTSMSSAFCEWESTYKVVISFGYKATIMPGDKVVFLNLDDC